MAYRRRYRRGGSRYGYRRTPKYSLVPFTSTFTLTDATQFGLYMPIVPASETSGMRKCKNFSINFTSNSLTETLLFAVVYLPEGAQASTFVPRLNVVTANPIDTFTELFAANQWVIGCGSIVGGSVNRFYSPLARNLNNGDTVFLYIWRSRTNTDEITVNATGTYAIRYN